MGNIRHSGLCLSTHILRGARLLAQPDRAPFLRQIDVAIMTRVRAIRNPSLTKAFTFAAVLGSYPFVFASLALATAFNLLRGQRARAATLVICAIGGVGCQPSRFGPTTFRAGVCACSSRNPLPEFHGPVDYCSPSLLRYGSLHRAQHADSRLRQWVAGVAVAAIVALICFSGVYMGFQWPSEAAAGTVAGAMWLFICIKLFSLTRQGHRLHTDSE